MPHCNQCNAFVTPEFVRVFGSNDREVFACPECTAFTELVEGAGARPEMQPNN